MLTERESRPAANRAAPESHDGDLRSVAAVADKIEQRRRVRLRRDLNRLADRLTPYDLPAAALARAWAGEVVA